ncbi:restriction endonuclease subunit S [Vibrio coralliirubri]|uniref:restriction endonuclease subunit S n=1 Tax=Vibrio coralliirubri TaxID=1516159 RepID=UPI002FCECE8C
MSKDENTGLIPSLRFPDFKLCEAWQYINANKLFKQISNKEHNSELPILAITQDHGAIPRDLIDYNVSVTEKSVKSYKVVEEGDFIISLRSFQGGIEYSKYKGICSPAYVILRKEKEVDGSYFKHYFKTKRFIRDLTKNLEGLRDGKMISYKQFSEVLLPLPNPEEQKKLAEFLYSLDHLITLQKSKLESLKLHQKGLMQQLFPAKGETIPELRFNEFKSDGEWNIRPLGKVAKNLDSKRIPITQQERTTGKTPYYGASGIIDYVKDYIFDEDLLCISEDGANLVARTYPIAFSISGKTWVNNHAHVLKFEDYCTQIIVENYLNSISLEDYLTGMAQPKLNRAKLDMIPIPLPKIDEQQKIADCLLSIDSLITESKQKIEALENHKKGLVQQVFPDMNKVVV